ncbi:MAG TPA: integrin alpha [Solirubrobacteraceae bacterium]
MAVQSAGERFMVGVRGRVVWTAVAVVLVAAAWCAPAFGALPQQSGSVDLLARANVQFDGASAGEVAGSSVAAAGDVNGDGLADIIVGAPRADDNGRTDSGSAYVVFGRATPAPVDLFTLGSAGFRIDGAASGDQAGFAVAAAGDVDGDGLADVIVGAPYADPVVSSVTRTDAGAAYVVFGRAGSEDVSLGALGARGVRFDGAQSGAHTGWSVAGTGDINGNRRPDLVIGAPDSNSAYVAFGRAPTVLQQVTGTTPVVDLGALGTGGFPIVGAFQSYAGISVAGSGDVNGDGRPDVIVGAPYVGGIGSGPGSAYVVFGKADAGSANLAALGGAGFSIGGAAPNDLAGWSVAGAGDVNGDGLADVIVGAPAADPGSRADAGAAYVVFGRTATTSIALSGLLAQGYLLAGAAPGDDAGWSVAGAGDVNGDGRPDVLVGAPLASSRGANTGAAYVSFSSGGPTTVDLADLANAGFSIQGAAAGSYAGQRVASAGDTNGDSRPDVIVGAPYADANALADSGSTYLLYGFGPAAISYPAGIDAVVGSAVAPLAPTLRLFAS